MRDEATRRLNTHHADQWSGLNWESAGSIVTGTPLQRRNSRAGKPRLRSERIARHSESGLSLCQSPKKSRYPSDTHKPLECLRQKNRIPCGSIGDGQSKWLLALRPILRDLKWSITGEIIVTEISTDQAHVTQGRTDADCSNLQRLVQSLGELFQWTRCQWVNSGGAQQNLEFVGLPPHSIAVFVG